MRWRRTFAARWGSLDPSSVPCIDSSKGAPAIAARRSFVELKDVTWNEHAREKILLDADRVLQDAVQKAASTLSNADRDEVYKFLFEQLKDRFIDFQPGPDLARYAEAVASGAFSSQGAAGAEG